MEDDRSSSSSDHAADVGSGSEKGKRKCGGKRGIVYMKKVTEARKTGIKIKVHFNCDGQPIGPNKSTFADYIGLVARSMIPLTDTDWRATNEELKQRIWEDIMQCFEVDDSHMHLTMKKVGKAARDFRAKMSKKCYDVEGNPILTPPSEYAHLKVVANTWLHFVEAVGSDKYQELSKLNSKSASSKRFLYRKGALGYAQLREKMSDKLDHEPPARQRLLLWKEARRKRDRQIDDDVQDIVNLGENISGSLTSEELLCRGPHDVLAKAMNKEYPGRVFTAGHGVTKKDYFRKKRDSSRDADVYQLTQLVLEMGNEIRGLKNQVQELSQSQIGTPHIHAPVGQSDQGSNPTLITDIPEGESLCDLFVDSPSFLKVGSGTVFRLHGQIMHTGLLKDNQVKVCISEIVDSCENIPLPYPNVEGEVYTVKHALGTFVAWPIKLVSLQKKVSYMSKDKSGAQSVTPATKRKIDYPREGHLDAHASFIVCKTYAANDTRCDSFAVPMSETFWGVGFEDHIAIDNVREIVNRNWLGASTICLYIRQLDHTHLVDILQNHEEQDHLIMMPYNIGSHWVLVSINVNTEYIYYMDPLRIHHTHPGRVDLVQKINNAMNSYRAIKRRSVTIRKKLTQNNWVSVECPRQCPGTDYCGFFVCLFMEDIIESGSTNLTLAYPQKYRCECFSTDRITHVQHKWCCYLYNNYLKNIV